MRKINIVLCLFILLSIIACSKKKESNENKVSLTSTRQESDCEKILFQLFYTSDFEKKEKYEVRIDDIRNDTIIIKAFTRNNLSDNPKTQEIVESVVGWFIIPPKRDALYLSLNALDPIEPSFKKIKTKQDYFSDFLNCNNQKQTNEMKNEIKFTDLFNEGTNIDFAPKDLNKDTPEIKDFKKKLEIYFDEIPLPEDFDSENLSYLVNNETFFDLQYYANSAWLQYFITKYKIDVTLLNDLMSQAIKQEDYNAVKTLINNHYAVSEIDLQVSSETKQESENKIQENKKDGYESYIVSNSKIDEIINLLHEKFNLNKISDPDGFTNLRKEKNTSSEILQKITTGTRIQILDNSGEWWLVQTKEGKKGYVYKTKIKAE
ncbi:SH3 domain-containing protein [Flavobacterium sp. CFBP9031]|uniref:SH3 domain-containing protein n=1 Tax=Flavobacterium sp. CFBP9031 TaxID=3096538 RepID=UPI002A6A5E31|nr:SH3 domain-containing protein [Flavobacterium sp. CFBP9031]MDY0989815.1 SH3 domain-containing protein [Flavobacterium sp. CFBP9031]